MIYRIATLKQKYQKWIQDSSIGKSSNEHCPFIHDFLPPRGTVGMVGSRATVTLPDRPYEDSFFRQHAGKSVSLTLLVGKSVSLGFP